MRPTGDRQVFRQFMALQSESCPPEENIDVDPTELCRLLLNKLAASSEKEKLSEDSTRKGVEQCLQHLCSLFDSSLPSIAERLAHGWADHDSHFPTFVELFRHGDAGARLLVELYFARRDLRSSLTEAVCGGAPNCEPRCPPTTPPPNSSRIPSLPNTSATNGEPLPLEIPGWQPWL